MTTNKPTTTESIESILKVITPIGAIIAFLVGVFHYRQTRSEDFKKAYWEKRYDVYQELCRITADLAFAEDTAEFNIYTQYFDALHCCRLHLVEDHHVWAASHAFKETLDRAVYPDSLSMLRRKSKDIGLACRLSLQETWKPVSMQELQILED